MRILFPATAMDCDKLLEIKNYLRKWRETGVRKCTDALRSLLGSNISEADLAKTKILNTVLSLSKVTIDQSNAAEKCMIDNASQVLKKYKKRKHSTNAPSATKSDTKSPRKESETISTPSKVDTTQANDKISKYLSSINDKQRRQLLEKAIDIFTKGEPAESAA